MVWGGGGLGGLLVRWAGLTVAEVISESVATNKEGGGLAFAVHGCFGKTDKQRSARRVYE